jgi:hypothetical protein
MQKHSSDVWFLGRVSLSRPARKGDVMTISVHTSRHQLFAACAAAALWLTACGGGGGVAATPPPGSIQSSTPASGPALAVVITADTQLAANTSYTINAPNTSSLTLTLPPSAGLQVNDTVSITGNSATNWTVAQNAGQSILTSNLNGNVAPGAVWTPRLTPKVWHWVSSDTTGQVLLAGEVGGKLNTSTDGGKTWTIGNSPTGIWISSDMNADGSEMVAVQYGGGMYTSVDFGAHWTQVTDPLVSFSDAIGSTPAVAANLNFQSVTMSQDGQHLAAVIQPDPATTPNGRLVFSNDGGATWTLANLAGQFFWRSVDSSATGQVIVAVEHNGAAFLSSDFGASWASVTVAVPLTPAAAPTTISEGWYRVKLSADGNTIALVANSFGDPMLGSGSGVFVSHDRGATWTRGFSLVADYTALAMSSDGTRIAATVSNPNTLNSSSTAPGRVLLSTDGGATFAPVTMPGSDTDWRAIAMSSDGDKMAAAAGNFEATPGTGQLYTSQGDRTSIGSAGSITGGQNDSVTLRYLGDGQWSVPASTGGPFTIQ